MSQARVHHVKHARQRFARLASGERVTVLRKDGTPKLRRSGAPITRRVSTADKAQPLPNLTCDRCGKEIRPGDPYRWYAVGFRSHFKRVRCTDAKCTPRPSELESSQLSEAYAAQEAAEDELRALRDGDPEDDASSVRSAIETAAEGIRECAQLYRDAAEASPTGLVFGEDLNERADDIEAAADELDGFYPDDFDEDSVGACSDHEEVQDDCDDCQAAVDEAQREWWDGVLDEADDALGGIGL